MGYKVSRKTKPRGVKAPKDKKWCPMCRDWRPTYDFYSNKSKADGLTSYCRQHHRDKFTVNAYIARQQEKRKKLGSIIKDTLHTALVE